MPKRNRRSNDDSIKSSPINRRRFLKASAITALGYSLGKASFGQEKKAVPVPPVNRIRKGEMHYRRLGRTDLMVSEISLGGSPVPDEPIFKKAIDMGINYVDTSSSYMNGNSEAIIGKAVKGVRDNFHVATKFHPGRKHKTRAGLIEEVEGSLTRLDTDYIDILLVHGARSKEWPLHEEVLAAYETLKKQGKIRFTGVSCHVDPKGVLMPIIESGHYDMITVGYNAFSGERIEKGEVYDEYLQLSGIEQVIAAARKKDVGVIAMKTMAGGERQNLSAFKTEGVNLPQAKLKWVLQNESVSGLITEMGSFDMLNENLAVTGAKMTGKEKQALKKAVRVQGHDYCRMCGTCRNACPRKIPVPDILRNRNYFIQGAKKQAAREFYRKLACKPSPGHCRNCEQCETACPYHVHIKKNLQSAHQLLC